MASPSAGFSDGVPWLPVTSDYQQINVAVERQDPSSMLSLYRRLINLRRASPALTHGAYRAVAVDEDVLCYERAQADQRFLVALNFGGRPKEISLPSWSRRHILLSTDTQGVDPAVPFVLRPHEGAIVEDASSVKRAYRMISDLWYKNAIIYCLSVGTFMDANGDGIGDFRGLARRLDYLHGLGITAIWLMPFQASPHRDDGYDVSDYYSVDPRYGTLGDFVDFTHGARQRGIRVLIDLVVNHTSDQHPWFKEARRDPQSQYHEWYVWSKKKPKNAKTGMVFPGVQKTTWSYDDQARAYYFHRFYEFQPDLNTSNPEVQAEILKIMGFWIQLGVSGFRMDAVPFVIASKGAKVGKPEEQYDMLRTFREFLQWRQGDCIVLAEANVLPETDMEYFGDDGERMHMMFNFQVNQHLFYALASADTRPLIKAMKATRPRPATAQWGLFLRNHDELDLGRLTEVQRQKVFEAFGPDQSMQLYDRGIRRRLAPMLGGDRRRLELAYSLLLRCQVHPWFAMAMNLAWAMISRRKSAIARVRRCSGRTSRMAGLPSMTNRSVQSSAKDRTASKHVNAAIQRRYPDRYSIGRSASFGCARRCRRSAGVILWWLRCATPRSW